MDFEKFKKYCEECYQKYPDLRSEIQDIYDLAISEIEQGSPEQHEIELAINDIEDLINDL